MGQVSKTRQQKAVAFDLHGVLFAISYREIVRTILHTQNFLGFVVSLIRPSTLRVLIQIGLGRQTPEHLIKHLGQLTCCHEKLCPCMTDIVEMISCHKPVAQMVKFARALKAGGIRLLAVSNIASSSLTVMKQRFPEIFGLFDLIVIPNESNYYVGKPRPGALKNLLHCARLRPTDLVLIDDKRRNVMVARNLGIRSILHRSCHMTRLELSHLGIHP